MSILNTQEWREITEAIKKKKGKIMKQILAVNTSMNETIYSRRDILIAQMEMLDFFLKKPEDIKNYKLRNDNE
ncbi:hypothetical protein BLM37_04445 [Candidatus Gracilibacteria bacterium GN02-873]|nr:hypothetical protein BLM37_04445 [Candidatus Gracilibacteria bacterium GN02-873]